MDKLATGIGVLLSVLSLGSAYDNFTAIGLLPKLIITALAAAFLTLSLANWLSKKLRPSQQVVGFGAAQPDRSKTRVVVFSLILAVLCAVFVWFAFYLTQRFTLQLRETADAEESVTLLIAPDSSVDSVTIELPLREASTCDWRNRSQRDLPPLGIQMIGWNSPTPKLHIDDFVYPQQLEIDCKPARTIRGGIIVPARTVIYLADTLWTVRIAIMIVGGLIWLVGCILMWRWSD